MDKKTKKLFDTYMQLKNEDITFYTGKLNKKQFDYCFINVEYKNVKYCIFGCLYSMFSENSYMGDQVQFYVKKDFEITGKKPVLDFSLNFNKDINLDFDYILEDYFFERSFLAKQYIYFILKGIIKHIVYGEGNIKEFEDLERKTIEISKKYNKSIKILDKKEKEGISFALVDIYGNLTLEDKNERAVYDIRNVAKNLKTNFVVLDDKEKFFIDANVDAISTVFKLSKGDILIKDGQINTHTSIVYSIKTGLYQIYIKTDSPLKEENLDFIFTPDFKMENNLEKMLFYGLGVNYARKICN